MKSKVQGKYTLNDILSEKDFINFCKRNNYKKSTIRNIANSLRVLCNIAGKMPSELLDEANDEQDSNVKLRKRQVGTYIAEYTDAIAPLSPTTRRQMFNMVKDWYTKNDITLPYAGTVKAAPTKENRYIPTRDDIFKSIQYASPRNKAIVLLQCSSGMGTAELLSIKREEFLKGIDRNTMITTLRPIRVKTQEHYVTFCSPEATKAVLLWLEEWDGEMLIDLKEHGLVTMYQRLSDDAGFKTEKGQFSPIRSHNMRKFFNNELVNAGMSKDLLWFFSGRCENDVQRAYYDWKPEVLKEKYMDYVKYVSVTEVIVDDLYNAKIEEMKQELNYQKNEYMAAQMELQDMKAEMYEIRKMLAASSLYQRGGKFAELVEKKLGEEVCDNISSETQHKSSSSQKG